MPDCRVYTVGVDGRFIGFEPLVCRDDGEAIHKAKQFMDGRGIGVLIG
jgi:hypothetical protein